MNGPRVWLRRGALSLLVLLLAFAVLTAHAVSRGEQAMRESDRAFHRGQVREAAEHARRAAIQYAPGAPHVRAAYERLKAVAVGAEVAGEPELARFAWRAMRSAALETQHWRRVHERELAEANQALARMQVLQQAPENELVAARLRKSAERHLTRDSGPRAVWIALLGAGLLLTSAGLAWLTLRGIQPDGSLRPSAARWAGLVTLVGAACWTWAVLAA